VEKSVVAVSKIDNTFSENIDLMVQYILWCLVYMDVWHYWL